MNNIFRRVSNVCHYLAKALPTDWYWLKRSVKNSMLYRGEEYLANRLLIMGHSVEKGITMPNRRYGFGYGVVRLLISLCQEYRAKYGSEKEAFQIALDDLREYLQIHQEANFELPEDIEEGIRKLMAFKTGTEVDCKMVTKEEFFAYSDFASFAHSRHTSRWFSDEEISDDTIKSVIELANTAPSACNRQSVRVKCVSCERKNEILGLQNGNRGFGEKINKLLVVTFLQPSWEYDIQSAGYLDAGIYTMNILYALHYHQRQRARNDFQRAARQMYRGAQRHHKSCHTLIHAVGNSLAQRHRDGRCRRRCAERREVCRQHIAQQAERILLRHKSGDAELKDEKENVKYENHNYHLHKHRQHMRHLAGMRHIHKNAENIQR